MWLRSLPLILLMGCVVAPSADAAEPGFSDAARRSVPARTLSRHAKLSVSPTTMLYGLCTFPTPEGLDRTCSMQDECSNVAAGERWQAGCWFR
jgi:hypothetical protein